LTTQIDLLTFGILSFTYANIYGIKGLLNVFFPAALPTAQSTYQGFIVEHPSGDHE